MDKRRLLRAALIVLCVLTLLFIWSNSVQSRDESAERSGRLLALIADFAEKIGLSIDRGDDHWLRKLAHFAEFGLLGAELACIMLAYERFGAKGLCACLLAGLAAAGIDETIQIFSSRGSSILDVLLDFCGVACAVAIVSGIYLLRRRGAKQRQ